MEIIKPKFILMLQEIFNVSSQKEKTTLKEFELQKDSASSPTRENENSESSQKEVQN